MRRRRLILHIGTQKTGTSAVQAWLDSQRSQLLRHGYLYPMTGLWDDRSHHHWAFAVWKSIAAGDREPLRALIEALKQELLKQEGRRPLDLILSSEVLEKAPLGQVGREVLEALFEEVDADVVVVASLRRQDLLMESWFKQWVKSHEKRLALPPREFVKQNAKHLDYTEVLGLWGSLRGVVEIKAATNALVENPIVQMERLLDIRLRKSRFARSKLVNRSLDGEALRLKFFANGFPASPEDDRLILDSIFRLDLASERLSLFTNDERVAFLESFSTSNEDLISRYGVEAFRPVETDRQSRLFATEPDKALRENIRRLREADATANRVLGNPQGPRA